MNDLPSEVDATVLLFVDYTKLIKFFLSIKSFIEFQNDFRYIGLQNGN